jgi:hypothetical protein
MKTKKNKKEKFIKRLSESFWSKFWKIAVILLLMSVFLGQFQKSDIFTVLFTIILISVIIAIIWLVIEPIKNWFENY